MRLSKQLSKQSWGWWFETLSRPLWRHCNDMALEQSWHLATGLIRHHGGCRRAGAKSTPGGRANIKMSSYQCRDPHVKYKTASRPSYLLHGNHHTWKDRLYVETRPRLSANTILTRQWLQSYMNRDVFIWKSFPHQWPFVMGIHRPLKDSSHITPVTQSFYCFFVVSLNKLN